MTGETVGPMSIAPRPAEPEALYLRFDATQNEPLTLTGGLNVAV